MKRERNEPTTVGDLDDLKADLSAKMDELKRDFTGSVNTMMEHVSSMMRAQGDAERTLQDKLDAHVADGTVHKRPARARRS